MMKKAPTNARRCPTCNRPFPTDAQRCLHNARMRRYLAKRRAEAKAAGKVAQNVQERQQ